MAWFYKVYTEIKVSLFIKFERKRVTSICSSKVVRHTITTYFYRTYLVRVSSSTYIPAVVTVGSYQGVFVGDTGVGANCHCLLAVVQMTETPDLSILIHVSWRDKHRIMSSMNNLQFFLIKYII